jgi:hypothetical protein
MREEPGLSPPEDHRAFIAANALRAALAKEKPWARPRPGADLGKLTKLLNAPLAFRISFPDGWGMGPPKVTNVRRNVRARLRRKRRAAQRRRR